MSLGIEIDVRDAVSAIIASATQALNDPTALNEKIAQDELSLVQDHLTKISNERHGTADKLGATPSRFWENASPQTIHHADAHGATIEIHHPGIGRAAHDVTIEPGPGKQYLTIPLMAEAYNQRAAGLDHLFVLRSHEGPLFLARHENQDKESGLEVLYLLVRSVTLPQDRTLLPEDDEFITVAIRAVHEYFDQIAEGRGNAT